MGRALLGGLEEVYQIAGGPVSTQMVYVLTMGLREEKDGALQEGRRG